MGCYGCDNQVTSLSVITLSVVRSSLDPPFMISDREIVTWGPACTAPDSERGLTHLPYFNSPLYEPMSQNLHFGGMSRRTHQGHLRTMRQLADLNKYSSDQATEDSVAQILSVSGERQVFRQRPCRLHFAWGTGRSNTTGLLNHMPSASA